jgi:biotin operon repressor
MVYFITDGTFTKIGKADDVNKRLRELQTGNAKKLSMKLSIEGDEIEEKKLHKIFHRRRMVGEWFIIDFDYDEELILNIIDIKFEEVKLFKKDTLIKITDALSLWKNKNSDNIVSIKEISNICRLSENTVRKYINKCCENLDKNIIVKNKRTEMVLEKDNELFEACLRLKDKGRKINKLQLFNETGISRVTIDKHWDKVQEFLNTI